MLFLKRFMIFTGEQEYYILLVFDKKYENIAKIPSLLILFYRKYLTL